MSEKICACLECKISIAKMRLKALINRFNTMIEKIREKNLNYDKYLVLPLLVNFNTAILKYEDIIVNKMCAFTSLDLLEINKASSKNEYELILMLTMFSNEIIEHIGYLEEIELDLMCDECVDDTFDYIKDFYDTLMDPIENKIGFAMIDNLDKCTGVSN